MRTGPHRRRFAQGGGVPALAGNQVCTHTPRGTKHGAHPAADSYPDIDASDQSLRRPGASKCGTDLACSVLTRRGASCAWRGSRTDRPQWTAAGLQFPSSGQRSCHSCLHSRTQPAPGLTPAIAASGLPRNHLLAPTTGVGSCRPPTTRQNANSCEDGVGRVGNFLRRKCFSAGDLVPVRPHGSRADPQGTTADSHARTPVWGSEGGFGRRPVSGWPAGGPNWHSPGPSFARPTVSATGSHYSARPCGERSLLRRAPVSHPPCDLQCNRVDPSCARAGRRAHPPAAFVARVATTRWSR